MVACASLGPSASQLNVEIDLTDDNNQEINCLEVTLSHSAARNLRASNYTEKVHKNTLDRKTSDESLDAYVKEKQRSSLSFLMNQVDCLKTTLV